MSNMESNIGRKHADIGQEITRPVSFQFDPARYRAELDKFDLTEDEKNALLSTLWDIMCRFVELGFSVDVCTALLNDISSIPDDDELR